MMDFKFSAVLLVFVFEFCAASRIPSSKEWSTSLRSGFDFPNSTIEHLHNIYLSFPCADRDRVEKLFNIFNEIRAPKILGRLETEEAEMELLHIMIFGTTTNVPLSRWYLIFEKVVDAIDESLPNRDERVKVTNEILVKYLTTEQRRRLNIFKQILRREVNPIDVIVLYTYLYGIPIGLSLGAPEEEITQILDNHKTMDVAVNELAKFIIQRCPWSNRYEFNEHSVRDLIRTMLNKIY